LIPDDHADLVNEEEVGTMFPRETYLDRRKTLMSSFDGGLLLFPGNGDSPMNYADNPYHFRQDSTFLYYFGLDQPDLAALIDIAGWRPVFWLVTDSVSSIPRWVLPITESDCAMAQTA